MCIVSMVHDDFNRRQWPWTEPHPFVPYVPQPYRPFPGGDQPAKTSPFFPSGLPDAEEVERLRKLVADYNEAIKLAERLDVLTKKPDCEDPEKAALRAKVAELERQLDAMKPKRKKVAKKSPKKKVKAKR
jgi:hypothetical protein